MRIRPSIAQWRDEERGMSSVALFILALPLLLLAFGYGFDSLRLVFIKESLQGRLNLAAQAGVSVTYTQPTTTGDVVTLGSPGELDGNAARQRAWNSYRLNTEGMRSNGRILMCSQPAWNVEPTNGEPCAGTVTVLGQPLSSSQLCAPLSVPSNQYGLKYTVNEEVRSAFLSMFGIASHELHNLTATALVRARSC